VATAWPPARARTPHRRCLSHARPSGSSGRHVSGLSCDPVCNMIDLERYMRDLEDGAAHRFADWPAKHFETGPSGVYTIWKEDRFLYAGMAWAQRSDATPNASGVFGRLASHASGRRSGDRFCIYICDRFVVPELSDDDIAALRRGERLLDRMTRSFVHDHLTYRVVVTANGAEARSLEATVRREGLRRAGRPQINP